MAYIVTLVFCICCVIYCFIFCSKQKIVVRIEEIENVITKWHNSNTIKNVSLAHAMLAYAIAEYINKRTNKNNEKTI